MQIALGSELDFFEIYVMNAEGSGTRWLSEAGVFSHYPAGRQRAQLVFHRAASTSTRRTPMGVALQHNSRRVAPSICRCPFSRLTGVNRVHELSRKGSVPFFGMNADGSIKSI
jgi:hypothetical protein